MEGDSGAKTAGTAEVDHGDSNAVNLAFASLSDLDTGKPGQMPGRTGPGAGAMI